MPRCINPPALKALACPLTARGVEMEGWEEGKAAVNEEARKEKVNKGRTEGRNKQRRKGEWDGRGEVKVE